MSTDLIRQGYHVAMVDRASLATILDPSPSHTWSIFPRRRESFGRCNGLEKIKGGLNKFSVSTSVSKEERKAIICKIQ